MPARWPRTDRSADATGRPFPTLYVALLLASVLFGWSTALVRPMFQVSDEISYFDEVQHGAKGTADAVESPATTGRAALFSGRVEGGRPLYRQAAGWLHSQLAARFSNLTAAFLLRCAFALTIPIVVLFTWILARRLAPDDDFVAVAAPLLVGLHPVFVSYAAGITPDALANLTSIVAVLLLVRVADGSSRLWELAALVAAIGASVTLKDTTFFLVALVPLAWLGRLIVWRSSGRREGPRYGPHHADLKVCHHRNATGIPEGQRYGLVSWRAWRADPTIAALPIAAVATATILLARPALLDAVHLRHLRNPLTGRWWQQLDSAWFFALVDELAETIAGYAHSFWANVGNFGVRFVFLPDSLYYAWIALSIVAVAGLVRRSFRPVNPGRRAAILLLVVGFGLMFLQAPVRRLVLESGDLPQGRWLFPMIAPLAVAFTAGLSAWWPARQRHRLLPLFTFFVATNATVALLLVLIPHYYQSFPTTYETSALFLGAHFRETSAEAVRAFIEGPSALRHPAVVLTVLAAFLASLVALVARSFTSGSAGPRHCGD